MATVTIPFTDRGKRIHLPQLCIVCGSRDCEPTSVTFSSRFFKPTMGVFGQEYRRLLTTTVPLCSAHRWHFTGQLLIGCATLLLIAVALFSVGIGVAVWTVTGSLWGIPPAVLLAVLAIVGLVFVVSRAGGAVQAREITERSITLVNVHRKFARAVEVGDRGEDERPRRARDREAKPAGRGSILPWVLIGGGVLMLVALIGLVVVAWSAFRRGGGSGNTDQKQPDPLPLDAAWNDNAMRPTYLSDLPEFDSHALYPFGKNGMHGYSSTGLGGEKLKIRFKDADVPKGLSMHTPDTGIARVKYRLDKGYRVFRGAAAMADLTPDAMMKMAGSPVVFSVLGDGRLLWRSQPLQARGAQESFRLSVAGVQELELQAVHQGRSAYTWSIWLDPVVLQ